MGQRYKKAAPTPAPAAASPVGRYGYEFNEIGSTGLNQWGGYIRDEFLRELQGRRGQNLLREMADNDDVVGAVLYAIEYLARQVSWRVDPSESESPTAEEEARAEWLEQALFEDMSQTWGETVSEALTMLPYGYCLLELVYKQRSGPAPDYTAPFALTSFSGVPSGTPPLPTPPASSIFTDNKIGWRKWAPRAQDTVERWVFDDSGDPQAVYQQPLNAPSATIPMEKLLLFRTSSKRGNPEGRSVLRNAFRSWQFKRRIQEIEGIGIERDLAGYPVLKAPQGVDIWNPRDTQATAAFEAAKKMVTGIRRDSQEGAILPFEWDLQLLSSTSKRQFDTNAIITRYDQRIAMTVLADFILIGHDAVGSKALSQTKLRGFSLAMTTFLDHICDVVNRQAIPRLFRLNGWPTDKLPKLCHGDVEQVDIAALADYVNKLTTSGAPLFPDPKLVQHLLSIANLPVPSEEELAARAEQQQAQADAQLEAMQQEAKFRYAPGDGPPDNNEKVPPKGPDSY